MFLFLLFMILLHIKLSYLHNVFCVPQTFIRLLWIHYWLISSWIAIMSFASRTMGNGAWIFGDGSNYSSHSYTFLQLLVSSPSTPGIIWQIFLSPNSSIKTINSQENSMPDSVELSWYYSVDLIFFIFFFLSLSLYALYTCYCLLSFAPLQASISYISVLFQLMFPLCSMHGFLKPLALFAFNLPT